jgi:hypothetical protein
LHDSEQRVQHVLQQLGGCTSGSCTQLYTTQLLQRALANEARTLYYLNHTRQQRLRNWAQVRDQQCVESHTVCRATLLHALMYVRALHLPLIPVQPLVATSKSTGSL